MPITKAIDLVAGQEYVLVDDKSQVQDAIFNRIEKLAECLVFSNSQTGQMIFINGPLSEDYPKYTCYTEDELDQDLVFNSLSVLNPSTALESLWGGVFERVVRKDDAILFYPATKTAPTLKLHHEQECCESVYLDDVVGDLKDLVQTPILDAKEAYHYDKEVGPCYFYDIRTIKGSVTLRFMHEHDSNTMYSAKATLVIER